MRPKVKATTTFLKDEVYGGYFAEGAGGVVNAVRAQLFGVIAESNKMEELKNKLRDFAPDYIWGN